MQQWLTGHKLKNGSYQILEEIGQGGFGITYKAKNISLDVPVVIKTPNSKLQRDKNYPKYLASFIKEAKQLAKLGMNPNPHIVRVLDFFKENNLPCIVMDYVPGDSLYNLVQINGALSEEQASKYIQQIGSALVVCHQQGIIHRDVHPNNVLIHAKSGNAILIDFGISGTTQTSRNTHSGNCAFAPWEQMAHWESSSSKTPQVDIYTLAAGFYYLVTAEMPTDCLARKYSNSELKEPKQLSPGLSWEINQAILKGMEILPENRPNSMQEWLEMVKINSESSAFQTQSNELLQQSQSNIRGDVKIPSDQSRKNKNTILKLSKIFSKSNSFSAAKPRKKLTLILILGILVGGFGIIGKQMIASNKIEDFKTIVKTPSESLEPLESQNNELNNLLQSLEIQYQAEKYQECYDSAIEKITLEPKIISDWIGKCGLALATEKASANSFSDAILIANTIPQEASDYRKAEENIDLWSGTILDYATKIYKEGNLEQAITITKIIPDNSRVKAQIPNLISQWQQEQEQYQAIIDNAQKALDQRNWQVAKQEAQKIPDGYDYWKNLAQTIINRANAEINILTTQKRKQEKATPQPEQETQQKETSQQEKDSASEETSPQPEQEAQPENTSQSQEEENSPLEETSPQPEEEVPQKEATPPQQEETQPENTSQAEKEVQQETPSGQEDNSPQEEAIPKKEEIQPEVPSQEKDTSSEETSPQAEKKVQPEEIPQQEKNSAPEETPPQPNKEAQPETSPPQEKDSAPEETPPQPEKEAPQLEEIHKQEKTPPQLDKVPKKEETLQLDKETQTEEIGKNK